MLLMNVIVFLSCKIRKSDTPDEIFARRDFYAEQLGLIYALRNNTPQVIIVCYIYSFCFLVLLRFPVDDVYLFF